MNDYMTARQEWDDRLASVSQKIKFLSITTLVSLCLAFLGMGFAIYTGARTQFIPYVVHVDTLGRVAVAQEPSQVQAWPKEIIKRELVLFIERFRTVSPDMSVIVKNHNALSKYLPRSAAASTKIKTYFGENDIRKIAESKTISVRIKTVNTIAGDTWLVEWYEDTYSRASGNKIGTKLFSASITLSFMRPKDAALIQVNPLGLFVKDIDVQEVFNE